MSSMTRTVSYRFQQRPGHDARGVSERVQSSTEALHLARGFSGIGLAYLRSVLPEAGRQLAGWRAKAADIPNPSLRRVAHEALAKRGNIEGAALFATLAPAAHRSATLRALVAFQTAYNYLDSLSERPSEDALANGNQLHQALLLALQPGVAHLDYYAHNRDHEDGGYLVAILDTCRDALALLPSYGTVCPAARTAAARIVEFQALNLAEVQGGHDALERWAIEATPPGSGLAWWETAGAAGSSLAVYALIAAAADPDLDPRAVSLIDGAYFPWVGALHSLLDSLVDRHEDERDGRRCLLDDYGSPARVASGLADLATRARSAIADLPAADAHQVILTAMCSYYLSAPQCRTTEGLGVTRALAGALGPSLSLTISLFRSKRLLHSLTDPTYS